MPRTRRISNSTKKKKKERKENQQFWIQDELLRVLKYFKAAMIKCFGEQS